MLLHSNAVDEDRSRNDRLRPPLLSALSIFLLTLGLAGCAENWHNPRKSLEQTKLDKSTCTERAEQDALLRAGSPRVDYIFGRPMAMPGMTRGEGPMEMLERQTTENDYERRFEACMTSRGYVRAEATKDGK